MRRFCPTCRVAWTELDGGQGCWFCGDDGYPAATNSLTRHVEPSAAARLRDAESVHNYLESVNG